jgi:hypothetical protein
VHTCLLCLSSSTSPRFVCACIIPCNPAHSLTHSLSHSLPSLCSAGLASKPLLLCAPLLSASCTHTQASKTRFSVLTCRISPSLLLTPRYINAHLRYCRSCAVMSRVVQHVFHSVYATSSSGTMSMDDLVIDMKAGNYTSDAIVCALCCAALP